MGMMIKQVSEAILKTPNASDYVTLVGKNAIAALRLPTDAMLAALHGCPPSTHDKYARAAALEGWQRAIDEALK